MSYAPKMFNKLPLNIKLLLTTTNLETFKRKIKTHLLTEQNT